MRNNVFMTVALVAALIAVASACVRAQQQQHGQGHGHGSHAEDVNKRGDRIMGFDHKKTRHRFLLHPDGGAIEVTANEAADKESTEQIRKHLSYIAKMFAEGHFKAPMLIHDRVPPGVPVMERLKAEIGYEYEETKRGARVSIKTGNAEALAAVHEFLRFQVKDHETGDSTEVRPRN